MRTIEEKRDSLRMNGWTRIYWAEVWMSGNDLNAPKMLIQVILPDGRVCESEIDASSEQLKTN